MTRRRSGLPLTPALLVLGVLAGCGQEAPVIHLDRTARAALERHLAGGEVEPFAVDVAAGELLVLEVEQLGVDLVLKARCDGAERTIDNWSGADGAWGRERLVWVADQAARCRVAVSASLAGRSGDFRLRIETLRPASERDLVWAHAEAALAAGDALYWRGPRGAARVAALGEAMVLYERARVDFAALGEPRREADAWFRLAEARVARGDLLPAIDLYDRALALYEQVGDERQIALSHHHRGHARYSADEVETALADFQAALALYRHHGDRLGEAQTLNEVGVSQRFLGEGRAALLAYDAALELWRELDEVEQTARTLHNRGRLYLSLGRGEQGLADLEAALALRRRLGRPAELIATLNFLGLAHVRRGATREALRCFEEALGLAGEDGGRAAAISRAGLGEVYREQGRLGEALAALDAARKSFRALGDRAWEAATTAARGRVELARGEPAAALASFEQARVLFDAIRDRVGGAETLLGTALAERELGRLERAREHLESALEAVEDLRARAAAGEELRAYFFATQQRYWELAVELAMALEREQPGKGHAEEALAAAERARARSLLESLGETIPAPAPAADPALVAEQRALEREINRTELSLMRLAAAGDGQGVARLEQEQAELMRRHERVREQLLGTGQGSPSTPRVLSPEQIRSLLDDETVLLVYRLGEARSFLWVLDRERLAAVELGPRAELEERVMTAYGLLVEARRRSRQRLELLLAELGRELLAPAAPLLAGKRRLAIVADGALHLLPFAALALPGGEGEPLVARYEIVEIPSASTLALLRARAAVRTPASGLLAVLADPIFGELYPRLEHAGEEAAAILALVPPEQRFAASGAAASRDVIRDGVLARYHILHFATHGELDVEHPELSRLVLALRDAEGRPREDGLLYAHEIRQLELPAELVVASACRTALGERVAGEGVLGLPRSLFDAGATRVVVSLWSVADQPTTALMERFYRALLVEGLGPPAALRAAQDEIRRDPRWRDPLNWAGFVFQGEWNDLPRTPAFR